MLINDFIIDKIFAVIKGTTLSTITPLRLRFFNGSTDITNSLFGINYYSLPTSSFSTPTNSTITNSSSINVGTALINFTGNLTLSFSANTDDELFIFTYPTSFLAGSAYLIPVNSLSISLPQLSTGLANFLLGYIFSNVTTNKPTAWYLELVDKNFTPIFASRSVLDITKFSSVYINELGEKSVEYENYFYLSNNTDSVIKSAKLYNTSTNGNSWFDIVNNVPYHIYNGRTIDFNDNSLIISIPPKITLTIVTSGLNYDWKYLNNRVWLNCSFLQWSTYSTSYV